MDYTEMKNAVDIVGYISRYVLLRQLPSGEFVGLCPLHHEDTPSFFVNREKRQFVCMGCHAGGDIITFIQLYHKVKFDDAVSILQYETGLSPIGTKLFLKETKKYKPKEHSEQNRVYLLDNCMDEFPESHEISEWIDEGISSEILTKHNVRYNNDKSKICFPIWDINGKIISVKYRDLANRPKYKYINKIGKKNFLYGMNFAFDEIEKSGICILFEGEKSVMKMETWGYNNSVAVGTHFIKEEIPLLVKTPCEEIVFAYDSDVPLDEIKRQIGILRHYKSLYYVPTKFLGEKEAPCDRGPEMWKKLFESRIRIK